jgi:hypothetical protein
MNTIYYCAVVTESNKSNSENNRKKCQGIHNSFYMILFHRIVPTIDRAQEIEFDETLWYTQITIKCLKGNNFITPYRID